MIKKRIYIETTIPSYLTARPCRDIIQMARQELTRIWWELERDNYDLFISQIVLDEASCGDEFAAQKRLELIADFPLLDLTNDVNRLADKIMNSGLLPKSAMRDAIHIAVSCVHRIDFLLTWNCKHIANAIIIKEIRDIVLSSDFELPVICTPEELRGD